MEKQTKGAHSTGVYVCVKCQNPVFDKSAEFAPCKDRLSFRENISGAVNLVPDHSYSITRIRVLCARCDFKLGHVFDDGRVCGDTHFKAGKRFAVKAERLKFVPEKRTTTPSLI